MHALVGLNKSKRVSTLLFYVTRDTGNPSDHPPRVRLVISRDFRRIRLPNKTSNRMSHLKSSGVLRLRLSVSLI